MLSFGHLIFYNYTVILHFPNRIGFSLESPIDHWHTELYLCNTSSGSAQCTHRQETRKSNNKKRSNSEVSDTARTLLHHLLLRKKIPRLQSCLRSHRKVQDQPPCNKSARTRTLSSGNSFPSGRHRTASHTAGRKMHNTTSDSGNWQSEIDFSRITICLTPPRKKKYPNIPEFGSLMNPNIFWIFQTQTCKIFHRFCLCCRKKQGLAFLR